MVGDKLGNFKKTKLNYIDLVFLVLHTILIIFPLLLVYKIIVLTIIGCILLIAYLIFTLYTFFENNPFYIYYCYGLLFLAFFYLMANIVIIPLLGLILITQFIYIYILLKNKRQYETIEGYVKIERQIGFRHGRYSGMIPSGISGAKDLLSPEEKLKVEQQKKNINAKYHFKRIRMIAIILTFGLFIVYIITVINIYEIYGIESTFP